VKHLARWVLPAWWLVAGPRPAAATTWVVDPGGPLSSIQAAIDSAQSGDQILVRPGWYCERLVLRDGVSIAAEVIGTAHVDAEGEGPCVTAIGIGSATSLSGLVLEHGSALNGGGLFGLSTNLTVSDCVIQTNGAVLGGAVYLRDGSRASFTRCTFSNNVASVGGGLYLDFAPITVSSSTISANYATDGAAMAASNAAEANVSTTSIYGNVASQGSTIAANLASPRFTNCTLAENTATQGTFGLRGSGTRLERCIVAFNPGPAILCVGNSSLWVGCNILYGNGSDAICSGDRGTNLFVDPLFCDRTPYDYELAENSPAVGGSCGTLGAFGVGCPAKGVATAVHHVAWSIVKGLYRR
jgi:hypothetical protein